MTKILSSRRATRPVPTLRPAMGAYQRELRRDIERAREAREASRAVRSGPEAYLTGQLQPEEVQAGLKHVLACFAACLGRLPRPGPLRARMEKEDR